MKTILTTAIISISSAMLASADVVAKSHEEVGKQTAAIMTEMVIAQSKITDEASAKAFAATMPAIKEKMNLLLAAAQALPAPTEAEKSAVIIAMEDSKTKAIPIMQAMMMSLADKPDAQAIRMILGQTMADPEMREVSDALEAMYTIKE